LKEEEASRLAGTPHLINLNEDPMLDRKVIYDIKADTPLTCGRRNKAAAHKLQLGGTGITPDHCQFVTGEDGNVTVKPLDAKAMEHIKVNGVSLTSMDGMVLKPNDRICLGPSAIFLFKNNAKASEASMEDTDENPISFDTAADEVAQNENLAEKAEQEKNRAEQEASAKKMVADLEAKMEAERAANAIALKEKEAQMAKMMSEAGSDEEMKKKLLAEIAASKL